MEERRKEGKKQKTTTKNDKDKIKRNQKDE